MIKKIFIHYLDNEFLKICSFKKLDKEHIIKQFKTITRIAVMIVDDAIIFPLSNYYESDIAFEIINDIIVFKDFNYIECLSSASNINLFYKKKINYEYAENREIRDKYIEANQETGIILPGTYVERERNSTKDISNAWLDSIDNNDWSFIYNRLRTDNISSFEMVMSHVPNMLDNKAFIAQHVTRLLPNYDEKTQLEIEPKINLVITKAYIESYLNEFNAVCIKDLPILGTNNLLNNDKEHVSYTYIVRKLYKMVYKGSNLYNHIISCPSLELLNLKHSKYWEEVLNELFNFGKNNINQNNIIKKQYVGGEIMNRKCFIVHGHADKLKMELKDYLQNKLKFDEPIILSQQPSKGYTIIEKFEKYADESINYVFVLLTPDDIQIDNKERTRQNVIFELGYFYGKFGRKDGKVILLVSGNIEFPSDTYGIIHIDVTSGIEQASEQIRNELN